MCIDQPTEQCCLCLAAYEKHDCAMLKDGTFVKLLLAAMPPPAPVAAAADVIHIGPERIALALPMVSRLGQALPSAGAQCKQLRLLSRDRVQERVPVHIGAMHRGVHLHAGEVEAGGPQRHPHE